MTASATIAPATGRRIPRVIRCVRSNLKISHPHNCRWVAGQSGRSQAAFPSAVAAGSCPHFARCVCSRSRETGSSSATRILTAGPARPCARGRAGDDRPRAPAGRARPGPREGAIPPHGLQGAGRFGGAAGAEVAHRALDGVRRFLHSASRPRLDAAPQVREQARDSRRGRCPPAPPAGLDLPPRGPGRPPGRSTGSRGGAAGPTTASRRRPADAMTSTSSAARIGLAR